MNGRIELDSAMDARIAASRARLPERLSQRDRVVSGLLSFAFVVAAVALAVWAPDGGRHPGLLVATFVVGYAVCSCIEFEVSTGTGVPTMLVLVPMLFVLPPGWAPLVVAAGLLAGGAWEWRRGRLHPERSLVLVSGAWHAVGPALVLSLAGAPPAQFGDVPLYAAALAAQFGFDFASAALRERIAFGVPARVIGPRSCGSGRSTFCSPRPPSWRRSPRPKAPTPGCSSSPRRRSWPTWHETGVRGSPMRFAWHTHTARSTTRPTATR